MAMIARRLRSSTDALPAFLDDVNGGYERAISFGVSDTARRLHQSDGMDLSPGDEDDEAAAVDSPGFILRLYQSETKDEAWEKKRRRLARDYTPLTVLTPMRELTRLAQRKTTRASDWLLNYATSGDVITNDTVDGFYDLEYRRAMVALRLACQSLLVILLYYKKEEAEIQKLQALADNLNDDYIQTATPLNVAINKLQPLVSLAMKSHHRVDGPITYKMADLAQHLLEAHRAIRAIISAFDTSSASLSSSSH